MRIGELEARFFEKFEKDEAFENLLKQGLHYTQLSKQLNITVTQAIQLAKYLAFNYSNFSYSRGVLKYVK